MEKKYTKKVHRLVAIAFIPIPKYLKKEGYTYETLTVNHKNGMEKKNNNISNLEWATQKEQAIHANRTGLCHPRHGEDHLWAKLTNKNVYDICCMLRDDVDTMSDIAKKYNVSRKAIAMIYHKKRWKAISSQFDFSNFNKTRNVDKNTLNEVIKLLKTSEYTCSEIANKYGISYSYVYILHKKMRK